MYTETARAKKEIHQDALVYASQGYNILTKKNGLNLLNTNLTNSTQTHYFSVYKGHTYDKTIMRKSFKLDQAFMNNIEKMSNCVFKSGRLSLRYFENVNTLLGSLLSQNI